MGKETQKLENSYLWLVKRPALLEAGVLADPFVDWLMIFDSVTYE
jgi:hypothetical protein